MSSRVCAVTGANGYLGSRVARALQGAGWTVCGLGRHGNDLAFSLERGVTRGALAERRVEALVHCAYDFQALGWERIREINVEGTRRLFAGARAEGVKRLVHISSVSAFAGARSLYGRAKLESEAVAASYDAMVVRPGLICGDQPGGMVGTLVRLVGASPVVPLIGSGRTTMYTVHEDDACALIRRLVEGALDDVIRPRSAPITAASESGIEFRALLESVAARDGRRVLFVPVPWRLVWLGVKALETLHMARLRSDSVVSFVHPDPHPDFTQTRATGVSFRPFASG